MRKNAMASSISKNNYRDLWKEVSKVRTKSKVTPQCMDDVTDSESIAELFANKYDMLYDSVCSNSAKYITYWRLKKMILNHYVYI